MAQAYSDPSRESDEHALPDVEVFYVDEQEGASATMCHDDGEPREAGWYYWFCFPGCMPDSDAYGPYATQAEALEAARSE